MHLKYISSTRIFSSRFTKIFLLFCACAFIGSSIGKIVSHNTARQTAASAQSSNWGLSFQEEGKRPVGNATIEELAQYNAFFAEDTEEKKIYLKYQKEQERVDRHIKRETKKLNKDKKKQK